jgi:hypothetical protein
MVKRDRMHFLQVTQACCHCRLDCNTRRVGSWDR